MKVILPKYKKRKINPFLATYFGLEGQGNKKVLEVNCSTTIKPMMGILMQNDFLQKSSVKKVKRNWVELTAQRIMGLLLRTGEKWPIDGFHCDVIKL